MKPSNEQLTNIALIGRTSLSLRDALEQTDYTNLRTSFNEQDLIPILKENPELLDDWKQYSEDKRTDGGFYLANNSIGSLNSSKKSFKLNRTALTALYIIKELDFWANLD